MPEHEASMYSPVRVCAPAGTRVFPETRMHNSFLTAAGRDDYLIELNFSKPSRTTYVQIFAVDRKH